METSQIEVESPVTELAAQAIKTLCDDISAMYGVESECEQREILGETIRGLQKHFENMVAVNVINSEGLLNGVFHFILDQEGLYTLGGIISKLPEENILTNRQNASTELAKSMIDSIGELGNLLVNSLNKAFSETFEEHNHFWFKAPAFIGTPWDKSEDTIGLPGDEEVFFLPYEMTIGSYPAFNCGVIFPKKFFAGSFDFAPKTANTTKETTQERN